MLLEFIMDKLLEFYPRRNYNRVIELPTKDSDIDETDLYPTAIRNLILHIRKVVENAVKETEEKIKSQQENVEGFLDVSEKNKKINNLS